MRAEPKLCAVAKPEHKGKVERAIRFLRDRFLAGRTITGVDEGNRALARFVDEIAHVRPHPTIAQKTVGDVFVDERARLLPLPDPLPETARVEPIQIDRQAFVRVDTIQGVAAGGCIRRERGRARGLGNALGCARVEVAAPLTADRDRIRAVLVGAGPGIDSGIDSGVQ